MLKRLGIFIISMLIFASPGIPEGDFPAPDEPILFAQTPALSPDGGTIAFSYHGDIWTVPAEGGLARRITIHEAHEIYPTYTPDGKHIVFSSNRHGNNDLFVVNAIGGEPRRLTFSSESDFHARVSADGKTVSFYSDRGQAWPGKTLYTIPFEGGTARPRTKVRGLHPAISPDGKKLAYCYGRMSSNRTGYVGSANSNIHVLHFGDDRVGDFDERGRKHEQLTDTPTCEFWPLFSPDGKQIYFVGEGGGIKNLYRMDSDGQNVERLTMYKENGVWNPAISADGRTLAFERDRRLFTMSADGGKAREVKILAPTESKENRLRSERYTSGIDRFSLSDDGKQFVFIVHGEVFCVSDKGGEANRLTETPTRETEAAISPDGEKIAFVSERNGSRDIFLLTEILPEEEPKKEAEEKAEKDGEAKPEEKPKEEDKKKKKKSRFWRDEGEFELELLKGGEGDQYFVSWSPDSKKLAYLADGEGLCIWDSESDETVVVTMEPFLDEVSWSPDSVWLAYVVETEDQDSQIYIARADGEPASDGVKEHNITNYPSYHGDPSWSGDGKWLAFSSGRPDGEEWNVYVVDLLKPAAVDEDDEDEEEKGKKGKGGEDKVVVEIDFDDIDERAKKITSLPSDEGHCAASPDGEWVVFVSNADENKRELWAAKKDGSSLKKITSGNMNPRALRFAAKKDVVYFRDGGGRMRSVGVGGGGVKTYGFSAKMKIDKRDELFVMFDEAHKMLGRNFYDAGFHGKDWDAMGEYYRGLIPYVAMKEDFGTVVSRMLGDLNASHLGCYPSTGRRTEEPTGYLGLEFDFAYGGPGLRISHVYEDGPCAKRDVKLVKGRFLTAIDGTPVSPSVNIDELLAGKIGKEVTISISDNPRTKSVEEFKVKPESLWSVRGCAYDEWNEKCKELVAEKSGGRLVWSHIGGMGKSSADNFRREVLTEGRNAEGVIVDVRNNGGGHIHETILTLLRGRDYILYESRRSLRGGLVLREWDRKWAKPAICLINEYSVSDAEIFPYGFRAYGLGKLVGVPTYGGVIGTHGVRLIDGTSIRIPQMGVYAVAFGEKKNMENWGVPPDIEVGMAPADIDAGRDPQLERAVKELLAELD